MKREYKILLDTDIKIIMIIAIAYIIENVISAISSTLQQWEIFLCASTVGFLLCEIIAIITYIKHYLKFKKMRGD